MFSLRHAFATTCFLISLLVLPVGSVLATSPLPDLGDGPSQTTQQEQAQAEKTATQAEQEQFQAFVGNKGANLGGYVDDPRRVAARVISYALGLLGMLFLSYTIYGGVVWMTSAGEEEKIKKGKSIIVNGVIGVAIILSAYAITGTVARILQGQQEVPEGQPCVMPDSSDFTNKDPLHEDVNSWWYPEGLPPCNVLPE